MLPVVQWNLLVAAALLSLPFPNQTSYTSCPYLTSPFPHFLIQLSFFPVPRETIHTKVAMMTSTSQPALCTSLEVQTLVLHWKLLLVLTFLISQLHFTRKTLLLPETVFFLASHSFQFLLTSTLTYFWFFLFPLSIGVPLNSGPFLTVHNLPRWSHPLPWFQIPGICWWLPNVYPSSDTTSELQAQIIHCPSDPTLLITCNYQNWIHHLPCKYVRPFAFLILANDSSISPCRSG